MAIYFRQNLRSCRVLKLSIPSCGLLKDGFSRVRETISYSFIVLVAELPATYPPAFSNSIDIFVVVAAEMYRKCTERLFLSLPVQRIVRCCYHWCIANMLEVPPMMPAMLSSAHLRRHTGKIFFLVRMPVTSTS